MAQNISILEGGTAQQFGQVNKLKIANSGGGTSLWVPEDELNTKSLHVDSNGTYYASQDECYGYDEVSVNITDECFGYDDDGNLWDVEVDDEGFLEEEEMPVRIEIVTPPDKTSYIPLEPINTAGMVVKAYYGDDSEYGVIPRNEITIDPIVAPATPTESDIYTDGNGVTCVKLSMSDAYWKNSWQQEIQYSTKVVGENTYKNIGVEKPYLDDYYVTVYNHLVYMKPLTHDFFSINMCNVNRETGDWGWHGGRRYNNNWIHSSDTSGDYFTLLPVSTANPENAGDLAKVCQVTVSYLREDGQELTDTFEITVNDPTPVPPNGDDSGEGGSSGGSW